MKKIVLFFLLLLSSYCFSQFSKTHYIPPISGTIDQPIQNQYIYISSPSTTPVNFQITPLGGTPINGTVSRNTPYVYNAGFGQNTPFHVNERLVNTVLSNKGYIIEAEDQIYAAVRTTATPDHYQAGVLVSKGLAGLGKEFRIGAFTNTGIAAYQAFHYTFIAVLATENNTTVNFSNIKPGVILLNNAGVGNTPDPVVLNRGQSYVLAVQGSHSPNRDGLIGALVSSDKPITVNCGSFAGTNGNVDNNLDLGFDQIVPFERTGTEYIFIRGVGQSIVEKALIVAHEDNTEVYVNDNNFPTTTLNAGQYYAIDGFSFNANGNLYVKTTKKVFCYQGIGGPGSQANQEMFFVPPLSCETPKIIDNIPLIERIGSLIFTGNINIATKTGAQLNFIINGANYSLSNLPSGVSYDGPLSVTGNPDYVTYTITGVTGNISVLSDKELYLSYVSSNGNASYGGYYSGFTFKPEVSFTRNNINLPNCIPNVKLATNSLSPFDTYQWYFNGNPIPGANNSSYVPTQPGYYYLSATISNCVSNLNSDIIPVSDCASDMDNDGINDNVDLDNDGDGISNCTESYGNLEINVSNPYIGTIVVQDYRNSFTANVSANGTGTHPLTPVTAPAGNNLVLETAIGKNNSISYEVLFVQPISITLEYASQAANTDLLNSNSEFIISVPPQKTITLKNPSNQLLVDTNFDGIYESGVTEFSSFEIRFRLNSTTPLAAGTGNFSFSSYLTPAITIQQKNLSDDDAGKSSFKLIATCVPRDSDGDGVPDQLDLDSDNDGIPDNIEAQGNNYIAPNAIDSNKDGISDVYGNGIVVVDTDNDGIPDYLDLDSDNDGIYDLIESGITIVNPTANGRIDSTNFGVNGLFDALETFADSGILNYGIVDTNADGIANYISLDSDGDGCFDTKEAGFSDANNDGLLGDGAVVVNAQGVVTNALGYRPPHANYLQYAVIQVHTQPLPQTVCEKEAAVFTVVTNSVTSYQWQMSLDNTRWADINNAAIFSGFNTPALTLLAATSVFNNTYYRVKITVNGNSCETYSDAVLLTVLPIPIVAASVEIVQCDSSSSGQTYFNLHQKEIDISANHQSEIITYYTSQVGAENQDITQLINNPQAFLSGNATIWAHVKNSLGCYNLCPVTLTVTTTHLPTNFMVKRAVCDDYIDAVHDDKDGIGSFDLVAIINEIQSQLPPSGNYSIHLYYNESDALAENDLQGNPLEILPTTSFRNSLSPHVQTLWVRVENSALNACYALGPYIQLTVEKLPVITPIPATVFRNCDDDHDGVFAFNTSLLESQLVNGQPLHNFIFFYFDENNNPLPSPLPHPFITPTQSITVRITNAVTAAPDGPCEITTSIQFTVDDLPELFPVSIPPVCDDETDPMLADGKVPFDTSGIEQSLLGPQTGIVLSYFDSNNQFLFHQLPNPFMSPTQNIKVIAENPINTNCIANATLSFVVHPVPQIDTNANGAVQEILCTDDSTSQVILNAGVLQAANIPLYTYQWYHNNNSIPSANSYSLTVTTPGTYSVEVSNTFSCIRTRTIEVKPSNIAIIENITINELSDNNTVIIYSSGYGDYVYSITGTEGPFQESNIFEHIIGGIYTIAVKDKNGCGIATETIAVLGAPKFFTPNGDGHNDTWNIRGVSHQFNKNSNIYIFDRYGKLLKQLSTVGSGWDGTYNGKPMPADDYWYTIYFEDGRTVKGHFTLKR